MTNDNGLMMPASEAVEPGGCENFPQYGNASRSFLRREATFVPVSFHKHAKQIHLIRTKTMDVDSNKTKQFHLIRHRTFDFGNKNGKEVDLDGSKGDENENKFTKSLPFHRQKTIDTDNVSSKSFHLVRDKTKEFLTNNKSNFKFVRHKTMDCDVWEISSIRSKESSAYSSKRLPINTFFGPENTPDNLSRPSSMIVPGANVDKKIPILGPTRQQTEIYFKKRKSLQGLTLKGPDTDTAKPHLHNNSAADTRTADTVTQETGTKIKSNIHTLSGSMVANKARQTAAHNEGPHDVRFFSELVKPLQYRMQTNLRDREKVITPSKYGYHPRSKSPTFKRLILATEKLQIIADRESSAKLKDKNEEENSKSKNIAKSNSYNLTDGNEAKTLKSDSMDIAVSESRKKVDNWKCEWDSDESEASEVEDDDRDSFIQLFKRTDTKLTGKAKVDFKIADAHAELHLFLPHINGNDNQTDRLGMNSVNSQGESENSDRLFLPSIGHTLANQTTDRIDVSPIRRYNRYSTARKKKRKVIAARCPSAYDPEKRVHDHLNDVNTLISIENEKCNPKDKICSFENCIYHAKLANAKN